MSSRAVAPAGPEDPPEVRWEDESRAERDADETRRARAYSAGAFDEDDLGLVTALVNVAAVKIENATLLEGVGC